MKIKSILLVDDEPIILSSLTRELVSTGLKVTVATSGEEAVARIKTGFFDLVTTDLLMPGLDGFQVLKAAKERSLQTIVIILTGNGTMETVIEALRLGADDFLQKPCDTDELLCRIDNGFVKQEQLRKMILSEDLLPVCCCCKKIRDDRQVGHGAGRWYSLEDYFGTMQRVRDSPCCCPDCSAEKIRPVAY